MSPWSQLETLWRAPTLSGGQIRSCRRPRTRADRTGGRDGVRSPRPARHRGPATRSRPRSAPHHRRGIFETLGDTAVVKNQTSGEEPTMREALRRDLTVALKARDRVRGEGPHRPRRPAPRRGRGAESTPRLISGRRPGRPTTVPSKAGVSTLLGVALRRDPLRTTHERRGGTTDAGEHHAHLVGPPWFEPATQRVGVDVETPHQDLQPAHVVSPQRRSQRLLAVAARLQHPKRPYPRRRRVPGEVGDAWIELPQPVPGGVVPHQSGPH